MKSFLLVFLSFLVLSLTAYCQCPAPGLKIQSAGCEDPKNLKILSITCNGFTITWTGNKKQLYVIKATAKEAATNSAVELKTSKSKCDSNGNCEATIPAKEGSDVIWSIQSVCIIENASLYSAEIRGPDVYIPHCTEKKENITLKTLLLNVYPNPSPGYLIIQYSGKAEGSMEFRIYDVAGKQVYTSIKNAANKTNNRYKLDLNDLPPGAYMFEAAHGNSVNRSKFVIMKK